MDQLSTALHQQGLRITPIRTKIMKVFDELHTPLSAQEVLNHVEAHKTTVYREIAALLANGYLTEIDLSDGIKRYELAALGHHHHLICLRCRSVVDVEVHDDLTKQEQAFLQKQKFTVLRHNLEFFGICHHCK